MFKYCLPLLLLTACDYQYEEFETKERNLCQSTQYFEKYFEKNCKVTSPIDDVEKFASEYSEILKTKPECGSFYELSSFCGGYW